MPEGLWLFGVILSCYSWRLRCNFGAVLVRIRYAVEECGYALLAGLICFIAFFGNSNREKPATFMSWWFSQDVCQGVITVVLIFSWQCAWVAVQACNFGVYDCALDDFVFMVALM